MRASVQGCTNIAVVPTTRCETVLAPQAHCARLEASDLLAGRRELVRNGVDRVLAAGEAIVKDGDVEVLVVEVHEEHSEDEAQVDEETREALEPVGRKGLADSEEKVVLEEHDEVEDAHFCTRVLLIYTVGSGGGCGYKLVCQVRSRCCIEI